MQTYVLSNKIVQTVPTINKVWSSDVIQPFKISDSDNNIYNISVHTSYRMSDDHITIEKLHFDHSVANIIYTGTKKQDWIYLSSDGLVYNRRGKLLSDKVFQQKISRSNCIKSVNYVGCD